MVDPDAETPAPTPYFEFVLRDVIVTSVLTSIDSGGRPVETVTLDYAAILWSIKAADVPIEAAWDSRK